MKKYGLLMILCCGLPLLLVAVLPGIRNSGGIVGLLPLLLCVGMHVLMIKVFKASCHGTASQKECAEAPHAEAPHAEASHAVKDIETQQSVSEKMQTTAPPALPKPEKELVS